MIRVVSAVLVTDKPIIEPASKLRGYIGGRFAEYRHLHNHPEEGGLSYEYPLVQYRIIEGTAIILGIEDGADTLIKILTDIDKLQLASNTYNVIEKRTSDKRVPVQPTSVWKTYRFITPWLALNQKNYEQFKKTKDWKERKAMLNNNITANILSMCKGLRITVDKETNLLDPHTHLDHITAEYKGIIYQAYTGVFNVNFDLPELFGLGKGVSHGFGVVLPSNDKS